MSCKNTVTTARSSSDVFSTSSDPSSPSHHQQQQQQHAAQAPPAPLHNNYANGKRTQQEKERKWQAKQARKRQRQEIQNERDEWMGHHSDFASWVTAGHVAQVLANMKKKNNKKKTNLQDKSVVVHNSCSASVEQQTKIVSLLEPYWNLQDGGSYYYTNTHSTSENRDASSNKNNNNSKEIVEDSLVRSNNNGPQRLFIAEGTETVRLLMQQARNNNNNNNNNIQIQSIFVKPSVFFDPPVCLRDELAAAAAAAAVEKEKDDESSLSLQQQPLPPPPPFHVLVADESNTMSALAGFEISRGALACGVVPHHHFTEDWFWNELLLPLLQCDDDNNNMSDTRNKSNTSIRLLALDGISDTANLGSMIRTAAAFGVHAILLSADSCDAWYRRAIRVSMGHVVTVPIVRVANLAHVLQQLNICNIHIRRTTMMCSSRMSHEQQTQPKGIVSYAAVIDPKADLVLEQMSQGSVPRHWCCVMGNEGNGISPSVLDACTHTIRIDMERGVDSLSVPIATGILLHGLKEREVK